MAEPEPFAELKDLTDRLDWTLDEDEERIAKSALEDLSDQARHYGRPWTDASTAPRMVRSMVLTAAVRYMRNPDGYVQSRAGDETLVWSDNGDSSGAAHFTDAEIRVLRQMGGQRSLTSAPVTAWNGRTRRHATGYVPASGSSQPFPYFADGARFE